VERRASARPTIIGSPMKAAINANSSKVTGVLLPSPDGAGEHTTSTCRDDASKYSFPYREQMELFQYASAMQNLNDDSSTLMKITIKKILGDLSSCTCSLFYSDAHGDFLEEFRSREDCRSSPLRRLSRKKAASILGDSPGINIAQQKLIYFPQVSNSVYSHEVFLPRTNENDLYESVLYVSVFDELSSESSQFPVAVIEISALDSHAFDAQRQLYARTVGLIFGNAICRARGVERVREASTITDLHHTLRSIDRKNGEQQADKIVEKMFLKMQCQGICLFSFDAGASKLEKCIEKGDAVFPTQPKSTIECHVAETQTAICANNIESDKRISQELKKSCADQDQKTIICVPILDNSRDLLGVLTCVNRINSHGDTILFSEKDVAYVLAVTEGLSWTMKINRLEDENHRQKKKTESIYAVMNYMKKIKRNQNDPSEVTKLLTEVSNGIISVDRVTFFAVDEAQQELVCIASKKDSAEGLRFPIREGIAGTVAQDGRTVHVKDAYACSQFNREVDRQTGYLTRNILTMPIRDHHNNIIAVIQLLNKEGGDFDELDEEIIRLFNEEVAPAIKVVVMELNERNGVVFRKKSLPSATSKFKLPRRCSDRAKRPKGTNSTHKDAVSIEEIQSWDFDVFQYSKSMLVSIVEEMFVHYDLPSSFGFETSTLNKYINAVMSAYKGNPFHNFHHAVSVVQTTFMMLSVCGADEYLEDRDVFAVLFAALVHDVDHPGNNNDFEVKSQSHLALQYNDVSVLENHASATAFNIAKKPENNIFKNFTDEDYRYTRKIIVNIILDTDMEKHTQMLAHIENLSDGAAAEEINAFDITDHASRQLLACMIVHTSDLSNPVHNNFDLVRKWSFRVCEEFSLQAQKEKDMGMAVTSFMDGLKSEYAIAQLQNNFLSYVLLPYMKTVAELLPNATHLEANCARNAKLWREIMAVNKDASNANPESVAASSGPPKT